jgi:4-amino-4-deoxy-L-arabinose transferase-like glycosyltransferase
LTLTDWPDEAASTRSREDSDFITRQTRGILTSYFELGSLVFVLVSASLIAFHKFIEVSQASSLEWDSGSFLTNAAVYAGYNQYQQALDPTRPPVIPFLLSLAFRVIGPNLTAGYVESAAFYVLALVGCFLIAKEMMNPAFAALASLSFGLAPFVFQWSGILLSDVEGVGVAAFALAILIVSSKRNKRLLLWALPLLILAPLTRYSQAVILLVAIAYLIAARKNDWILDHYEFYYGFGLSILVFAIFGGQWVSYPFTHHTTIAVLFPTPGSVSPFQSSLGSAFYAVHFTKFLGLGFYGDLLALIFGVTSIYVLARIFQGKPNSINPISLALIVWFLAMFTYYSVGWPYSDSRYSIEFVMPVIILSFYGLSLVVERAKPVALGLTEKVPRGNFAPYAIAMSLILLTMSISFYPSGYVVMNSTPPQEANLNAGLKAVAAWMQSNIPTSDKVESNWYTLMWWYAPNYSISPAPLNYQLSSESSYAYWQKTLASNRIAYVVYIDPTPAIQSQMPMLHTAFSYTSSQANVVVYSVS